jgi:hypothetical protein
LRDLYRWIDMQDWQEVSFFFWTHLFVRPEKVKLLQQGKI